MSPLPKACDASVSSAVDTPWMKYHTMLKYELPSAAASRLDAPNLPRKTWPTTWSRYASRFVEITGRDSFVSTMSSSRALSVRRSMTRAGGRKNLRFVQVQVGLARKPSAATRSRG